MPHHVAHRHNSRREFTSFVARSADSTAGDKRLVTAGIVLGVIGAILVVAIFVWTVRRHKRSYQGVQDGDMSAATQQNFIIPTQTKLGNALKKLTSVRAPPPSADVSTRREERLKMHRSVLMPTDSLAARISPFGRSPVEETGPRFSMSRLL